MGTQTSITLPLTIGDQIPASACVPGVDYMVDCDENGHPPYRMTFKAASGGKYKFTDAIGARADLDAADKVWRLPPEQAAPVPVSELIPVILVDQPVEVPDLKSARGRKAKKDAPKAANPVPPPVEPLGAADLVEVLPVTPHSIADEDSFPDLAACPAGVEGCANGCDSQTTHAIWASCPKWAGAEGDCKTCGVAAYSHPGAPTPASRGCKRFVFEATGGFALGDATRCEFCCLPQRDHVLPESGYCAKCGLAIALEGPEAQSGLCFHCDPRAEKDREELERVTLTSVEVDMLAGLLRDRALAIPKAALSAEVLDVLRRLKLVD